MIKQALATLIVCVMLFLVGFVVYVDVFVKLAWVVVLFLLWLSIEYPSLKKIK